MSARIDVYIHLKPGMLDPQGETLEHALEAMGYEGVEEMRVGKWITFALEDAADADSRVEEMCRRLLANPVIEEYRYEIRPDTSTADAGSAPTESA